MLIGAADSVPLCDVDKFCELFKDVQTGFDDDVQYLAEPNRKDTITDVINNFQVTRRQRCEYCKNIATPSK